jgi:hypothetical protein
MRSRAHRRHQRHRVINKRIRQYERVVHPLTQDNWDMALHIPTGVLADEQAWLGCRRAKCRLCHPHKLAHSDRQREQREWRSLELAAW